MEGGISFLFAMAFFITSIYRIQTVHLDPLQLVLVGTVLEATCFLFEVPTGVVADTFSRRMSVLIGLFLLGGGFLIEGSLPLFWAVLLAQVVMGIGYTFISGATEAWIAGEVGEGKLAAVFTRSAQVSRITGLAGIVAGVGLASIGLNLPILAAGALMLALAATLVLLMPETGFERAPKGERTTWASMGHTFAEGARAVRGKPVLVTFLVIAGFLGAASEGFDRLWEAHFLMNFQFPQVDGLTPVMWFGIMDVGATLIALAALEIARRRVRIDRRETLVRALVVGTALRIGASLLFVLAPNFWVALGGRWGRAVFSAVSGPWERAWLAESIDPKVRATVLSMTSQVDALGQIAVGPGIGAVGSGYGVRAALGVATALMVPTLPLYLRAGRQEAARNGDAEQAAAPVPAEG